MLVVVKARPRGGISYGAGFAKIRFMVIFAFGTRNFLYFSIRINFAYPREVRAAALKTYKLVRCNIECPSFLQ